MTKKSKSIEQQAKKFRDKKRKEEPDHFSTKYLNHQHPEDKAIEKFKNPDLILKIYEELSKDHLKDDKEKVGGFVGTCTGKLEPAKIKQSIAILGDSSVGKDNLMKTILKHIPTKDWIFLTRATEPVMEDDIQEYSIIAYSEFNVGKESGANISLTEVIKQLAEGGTSAFKKDVQTGYKTTKHTKQEQKTVLYSTVETQRDEELETRFVCISVTAEENKIKAVNEGTMDFFAGLKKETIKSWIAQGISTFKYNKVIIPFATTFKEKINGKYLFDYSDPRSMRDVKRFFSFVCAFAWLHQLQRKITPNGYIIAKSYDFLLAVIFCADFFNQTYKGVELRTQKCLDVMDEWFKENPSQNVMPRQEIQGRLKVSRNTLKRYLNVLSERGYVEFVSREGNILYYKRCQKGVKKAFIRCQFKELLKLFKSDTLPINTVDIKGVNNLQQYCSLSKEEEKILQKCRFTVQVEEIDTLNLIPSQIQETKNELKVEEEQIEDDYTNQIKKAFKKGKPTIDPHKKKK